MQVTNIVLNNFRCFSTLNLSIDKSIVLIEGGNGTGKTSLLEAFHYLCYLRSFRTYSPKHLIQFAKEHFFVKAYCSHDVDQYAIQAGFSKGKRLVKIDNVTISSFKDLMGHYRVISLTEDDVLLIKGGPSVRRSFVDQALILFDIAFIEQLRLFRVTLDNRNMLLKSGSSDSSSFDIWTNQLEEISSKIQQKRSIFLSDLSNRVNALIDHYFNSELSISFTYIPKQNFANAKSMEFRLGRSLFGAHLDDFLIEFKHKHSGSFASRGQQKLIIVLLKIAQVQMLSEHKGACLFLMDDFLTDFDIYYTEKLVPAIIALQGQQIFTSPMHNSKLTHFLQPSETHIIKLPI